MRTSSGSVSTTTESIDMGFPSPAADFVESRIDLNKLMVHRPSSTIRIETPRGFALVDSSITPVSGNKVACRSMLTLWWGNTSDTVSSPKRVRLLMGSHWMMWSCSALSLTKSCLCMKLTGCQFEAVVIWAYDESLKRPKPRVKFYLVQELVHKILTG